MHCKRAARRNFCPYRKKLWPIRKPTHPPHPTPSPDFPHESGVGTCTNTPFRRRPLQLYKALHYPPEEVHCILHSIRYTEYKLKSSIFVSWWSGVYTPGDPENPCSLVNSTLLPKNVNEHAATWCALCCCYFPNELLPLRGSIKSQAA